MADFGNIAGVVKKFTQPLNDDLSPKTFVLWAKETVALGAEVTLMRYDFIINDWVPLSSEESVFKVDAATDINTVFVGITDIDGITLVNGNRVLLFGQTDPIENGLYESDGAGALTRPARFSTSALGDHLIVSLGGTKNKYTQWMPTNASNVDGYTIDTDAILYTTIYKADPSTISAGFNLGYTAAPAQGTVTNSSTGTNAVIPVVDVTNAGLMSPSDKKGADAVIVLSGMPAQSAHLGTFTGTTIADNQTVKVALQALETILEAGIAATKHIETFASGDFAAETISIPQATHLKGVHPVVQVIDTDLNEVVLLEKLDIDISTGNINIIVGVGLEFNGVAIII